MRDGGADLGIVLSHNPHFLIWSLKDFNTLEEQSRAS
jgi:hypothetical protein